VRYKQQREKLKSKLFYNNLLSAKEADVKLKRKMRKLVLLIIPALICGVVFTSCEKAEQNGQETAGRLKVIGTKSETISTEEKNDLVFTDNDIISFNITSGEIVFTDKKVDEIISRLNLYSKLHFIIDEKPMFVPPIAIMHLEGDRYCGSPLPWASMNDLGLLILNSNTCFLVEGYLPWHFLSDNENDREAILKEQEENSKMRKKELEVLIEHLSKSEKIIE
jgi:hypothetical protein